MRRLGALAVVSLVVALVLATPASADEPVAYAPPVDGPVVDPFRPPEARWGPGNRGVDFATTSGGDVRAAADGEVVYAGSVAGSLHVVLLHRDGLRTSYSFLDTVLVRRGESVSAGDVVGRSGASLHFGVRAGDVYLDPLTLLTRPARVYLVPDDVRRPATQAKERGALERLVRAVGKATDDAVDWARDELGRRLDELRGWAHYADAVAFDRSPIRLALRSASALRRWYRARDVCTPDERAPPPRTERHLLVRVAGLGSHTSAGSTEAGAIADLDAAALGYRRGDVVQFSYRGGTTAEMGYDATDTQVSIRDSARRLRALLERLATEHPGVPVDLVAHSQGGLVARAALALEFDGADGRLPRVANLVTLGTPHRGADLATSLRMVDHTDVGGEILDVIADARVLGLDPEAPSIAEMAETSTFIADLERAPLPSTVRVTSIAARGDLVVAADRSEVDGATNVVVDPGGVVDQHDRLPGSAAGQRAVALALAGAPPACESAFDAVLDVLAPAAIGSAEDAIGAAGNWFLGSKGARDAPSPPRR